MKPLTAVFGVLAAVVLAVAPAGAQPLGTFSWQLLPHCNVLTLSVVQIGGIHTMSGTDDQCGAPAAKASVSGLAFVNPSGSIGMGLTIVTPTTGAPVPVHLDVSVAVRSLSGTWRDRTGNSGEYFTATGSFTFLNNSDTDEAACAITQGTTVEFTHRIAAGERSDPSAIQNAPIGVTRGFDVPAEAVTINFVCVEYSGSTPLENPSMTAQFFPVP